VKGFHDFVLAREHGGEVEADLVEDDAVLAASFFAKTK
jgi:hypothetical protein